jgi:hypothetical protein
MNSKAANLFSAFGLNQLAESAVKGDHDLADVSLGLLFSHAMDGTGTADHQFGRMILDGGWGCQECDGAYRGA